MGRVAKYKKIKSFDKQHRGGEYIWGTNKKIEKKKKRSKTAEKYHKEKQQRKRRKGLIDTDDGFDIPFDGKDEFNLTDFKVKKQRLMNDLQENVIFQQSSVPTLSSSTKSSSSTNNSWTTTRHPRVYNNKIRIGNKIISCKYSSKR